MLLNPPPIVNQALFQAVNTYPVCEKWILLLNDIGNNWGLYSQSGLKRLSDISLNIEKVLNWIQSNATASAETYVYLQALATGAHTIGTQAYMSSINAQGTRDVILTSDAVNVLATLKQWDSVLNLYTPTVPDSLGLRLIKGVNG